MCIIKYDEKQLMVDNFLFPRWLCAGGSDLKLYYGSDLKTSRDTHVRGCVFGQAHIEYILLRYSVVCTVEFLSLLYNVTPFYILICMYLEMMHQLFMNLSCDPNSCVSWSA